AEDGIRDDLVTGVQTCALPIFETTPPYATGPEVLFVAFYASAELGCYRALGWPMPERILDLFTEFRVHTNMGSKIDQDRRTPNEIGRASCRESVGVVGGGWCYR